MSGGGRFMSLPLTSVGSVGLVKSLYEPGWMQQPLPPAKERSLYKFEIVRIEDICYFNSPLTGEEGGQKVPHVLGIKYLKNSQPHTTAFFYKSFLTFQLCLPIDFCDVTKCRFRSKSAKCLDIC